MRSLGTPVCSCHPIGPCIQNPVQYHQPCYNTKPNLVPDRGRRDLSYPSSLKNVASVASKTSQSCFNQGLVDLP
ncbi:hypothetical protein TNCV_2764701 [Trichonephila clavipes]|nr:hypothetical protein TNCV_2764701 [Trichonephila clavipes]